MTARAESRRRLERLFARRTIADLPALERALGTPSRTTVFRALREMGYTTSCSHARRYYAPEGVPQFDETGLWVHEGVLFSRDRTLRATLVRLVQEAPAGQTHAELQERLRLRVHDTLRQLTQAGRIGRAEVERLYVYVSIEQEIAQRQLVRRREWLACRAPPRAPAMPAPVPASAVAAPGELGLAVVVEVLLEVLGAAGVWVAPEGIARRLCARGLALSPEQVERVLREHGLKKKRARSGRSPP